LRRTHLPTAVSTILDYAMPIHPVPCHPIPSTPPKPNPLKTSSSAKKGEKPHPTTNCIQARLIPK
jgi:hypothetical protein